MTELTYTDHLFATGEEALAFLHANRYELTERVGTKTTGKNRRLRCFHAHVQVGMPVTEGTYLPAHTSVRLDYKAARALVEDLGKPYRTERGAKVKITVSSGGLIWIG